MRMGWVTLRWSLSLTRLDLFIAVDKTASRCKAGWQGVEMESLWNRKLMKRQVDEVASWWKVSWRNNKLLICEFDETESLKQYIDLTTSWRKSKLMKLQANQMASWWNCKLIKWQVDKIASCWNSNLLKHQVDEWQVDKMASWWIGKLMKWQVDEMASWWSIKLMKDQVDEASSWWRIKLMK